MANSNGSTDKRLKTAVFTHSFAQPNLVDISFYNDAQERTETPLYDTAALAQRPEVASYLLAEGFISLAKRAYNNKDRADAPQIVADLFAAIQAEGWAPSEGRAVEPAEPTVIEETLAEYWNLPIDVVRHTLETTMKEDPSQPDGLYRDRKGRTHKAFDAAQFRYFEEHDARYRSLLSKYTDLRAARLRAEAKAGAKGPQQSAALLSRFMSQPPAAA